MHAQLVQDGGISYSCDTPILCHLTGDHHNFKGVVRFYTSCCWGGENSWETHKRENADVGRRRVGHEYNYVAKLYTLEQERRYPMATSSQQRQSAGVKTPASRKPGRLKGTSGQFPTSDKAPSFGLRSCEERGHGCSWLKLPSALS